MRVGIHQINYFPWIGYFNKIAKSDVFILLDKVQLIDNGMMHRNRILNKNGEISYITISFNKKNYFDRDFSDIEVNNNVDWLTKQYNLIADSYRKAPYWKEINDIIYPFFHSKYERIIDVNLKALELVMDILEIKTKLVFQSSLEHNKELRKDDLLIELLKDLNANIYLSGTGAKKYMIIDDFKNEGIDVQFQTFESPKYQQNNSDEFIPGLSILDVLFNCGVQKTKELFWSNLQENEVNE
ncbi:MAG: WbqC family protein [Clostridia bacterium]|nr:WbqC family protein [Clostridia bacterium]